MPVSFPRDPTDNTALRKTALHPHGGTVLIVCRDIRNHSDNQSVDKQEYESHESMAMNQMDQVAEEASQKWPIHYVEIIHRLGIMEVMECSIAIAVSTSHRADAYEASRFIIDTVKRSVPIWKKEFFSDGNASWCDGCAAKNVFVPGITLSSTPLWEKES
jgi:Molybdopterin converting factor, large subunit